MKEATAYIVAFVVASLAVVVGVVLVRTGVAEVTGAMLTMAGAWFAVDAMFAYGDLRHPALVAVKRAAPKHRSCRIR